MFSSAELNKYLPPLDELVTKMDEVNAFCQGQIAAMQSLDPQDAKIRFIGNLPSPSFILFHLPFSAFWCWQLSVTLFFALQRSWPPCLCLGPTFSWSRRSARKVVPLHAWSGSAKRVCCSSIPEIWYVKEALPTIPVILLFPWPNWTLGSLSVHLTFFCHQLATTYACCVEMSLLQICHSFFFPI